MSLDEEQHLVIIHSYGQCHAAEGTSIWYFLAPLIALHFGWMVICNVMLYKVRNIGSRYQERKYIALATLFSLEILVVGFPVLLAIDEINTEAFFIVVAGILALNDIGVICFLFIPKIFFQKQGLMEGVGLGESLQNDTYKKAISREHWRSMKVGNPLEGGM